MVEKLFNILHFLLDILAFSCISYNITINTQKCMCPVEVYLIEGYLIGKGVTEVSGFHCKQRLD